MGRKAAVFWHATLSVVAGLLYFFFVLPRWPELMGDTTHALGTAVRVVAGVVIALAALPVVFTWLRNRKPEYGTPRLALTLQICSIVAHVLAGVLIVGTAISEIWLNLDSVGQWLFGVYGAAAAIAVLGILAFYLSFVAELPPPPPKPIKPKKKSSAGGAARRAPKPTKAKKPKPKTPQQKPTKTPRLTARTPRRPKRRIRTTSPRRSLRKSPTSSRRPKRRPPWRTPSPTRRLRAGYATGARAANRHRGSGGDARAAVASPSKNDTAVRSNHAVIRRAAAPILPS